MKKGLLSILAGALVVVGCQNYDDQFDSLESQISALASTVAGLTQVQSDLASLAGTVSSLSSTVNGLGAAIDTAVSDGLADIQADIDAIETAVADVASSEEVSALQAAVDASQEDLEELLANSSVYQGAITINSPSTLDVYHKMGSAIAIVNDNVTITMKTTMDETKMQEVIDQILVTTGNFSYTSEASSIAEMTFNNLSGVQSLTVEQAGGYQFQGLGSATYIDLGDAFKSSVTKIDFRELTSVTQFETENVPNEIRFTKAVECHLTKLVYYPQSSLTIVLDEGAALPLALDDVDGNGDQTNKSLSITGPDSVTIENWTDGTLSFTDVKTVVVNGFEGTINANAGVESLSADKYAIAGTLGADLETVNLTGITDPDDTTDTTGPAISLEDQTNIETLTLAGKFASVNVEGCSSLTDVVVSADVAGAIVLGDTGSGNGNSDLANITLTGAKASTVEVSNNSDLETLTIDVTFRASAATGAVLDGSLTVKDNASLSSLTVSSDKIETLAVTGNDELATVDFTGLKTFGATGEPTVNIYDNDLTATAAVDSEDTTATADGAAATDLGSFTTTSGMNTLKTYLTAVAADADTTAAVWFDTVESYTNESDQESTDKTYDSSDDEAKILVKSAETTPAKGGTKAKVAYKLTDVSDGERIQFYVNGNRLLRDGGGTNEYISNTLVLSGNQTTDIEKIKNAAHLSLATDNDVTLNAYAGGNDNFTVSIIAHYGTTVDGAAYTAGERYSTAAALSGAVSSASQASYVGGLGTDDIITLTVGSNTATATVAHAISGTNSAASVIATAIASAWASKYGSNGTKSSTAVASLTIVGENQIRVDPLDPGLRGHNIAVSFSIANSTSGPTSVSDVGTAFDYLLGATRSTADNVALSDDIIVTLESNMAGTILNKVKTNATGSGAGNYGLSWAGLVPITLIASQNFTNATDPLAGKIAARVESRSDVRPAEDGVAGSGDAESYSRVHWLAD